MKALIVAVGSAGDVHPFVGLGIALAGRGHEVTVICSAYFETLVRSAGLGFAPLGTREEYQELINDPRLFSRFRGFGWVMRRGVLPALRPIYDLILEHHVPGETLIVASSLGLSARAAHDKLGAPLATVHLSPALFRSDFENPVLPGLFMPHWLPLPLKRLQFWLADNLIAEPVLGTPYNQFRQELGLPPVGSILTDGMHSPQCVIGLFPSWYATPQPDWPAQTVVTGFPLYDERGVSEPGDDVKRFLAEGEPPIAFTPGSAMIHGQRFFAAAAEACKQLGRRGVLLTRFPEQLPAQLPAGVRHFAFVPFGWLLPHCAAVVHHGGIGSSSQGLAAGIPQLIMPMSHDQPDNAARLARLGVSTWLSPRRFTGRNVAAALLSLLGDDRVALRCREIAERIALERPLEATGECLERLWESKRERRSLARA